MIRLTDILKRRGTSADTTDEITPAHEGDGSGVMRAKAMTQKGRSDDGFSVVEVVFAAAILFFALTALIGLMGVSSTMTGSARAKSVLSNAITSELDWVRSIPFEKVGLTTQIPPGDIPASRTYVKDGFTITMTFSVTDMTASNGTKEVRVNAVASRQGQQDVQSSAFAAIRNRIGTTMADADGAPIIEFIAPTPAPETVVVSNRIGGTGEPLTIAAKAWSENYAISRIEFMIGTTRLRNGNSIYADVAQVDFSGTEPQEQLVFNWHTGQVDNAGIASVLDGRRVVRVVAYDDQGRPSAARERIFLVDNFAPAVPDGRALQWQGWIDSMGVAQQSLAALWNPAMDGTDYAPYHESGVFENTNGGSTLAAWTPVASLQATANVSVGSAMGCYSMRTRALSPLQNPSEWGTVSPVVTRPVLTGSCDVTRAKNSGSRDTWTFVTRSTVMQPRFPFQNSSLTVEVLKTVAGVTTVTNVTTSARSAWNSGGQYTYSDTHSMTIGKSTTPVPPNYRIRVTVAPNGWGSASQTVTSNSLTPWVPNPISTFEYDSAVFTITAPNQPVRAAW